MWGWAWVFVPGHVTEIIFLFIPCKQQQLCQSACRKQQCPCNNICKLCVDYWVSVMLAARARHPCYGHILSNNFNEPLVVSSQLQHKPRDCQGVPWDCDLSVGSKRVADTTHSQSTWKRKLSHEYIHINILQMYASILWINTSVKNKGVTNVALSHIRTHTIHTHTHTHTHTHRQIFLAHGPLSRSMWSSLRLAPIKLIV